MTQIKQFRTFSKHAVNTKQFIYIPNMYNVKGKGKVSTLQARCGPEGG